MQLILTKYDVFRLFILTSALLIRKSSFFLSLYYLRTFKSKFDRSNNYKTFNII